MMELVYQDYFSEKEEITSSASKKEIIDKFKSILWYEDALELLYSLSSASRGREERFVRNHFCFFQLKNIDLKGEKTLLIIPDSVSGIDFQEKDFGFSVDYLRPKLIETKKLMRFFGAPAEKVDSKYISHDTLVSLENVVAIIERFINHEDDTLEKMISNQGASQKL